MAEKKEQIMIAVCGAGEGGPELMARAEAVGRAVAEAGAVLVCGGLGGVMSAAAKGAKLAGGRTVGILPGPDRNSANPWIEIAVPTDMGHARNAIIVRAADAVIAVGGEYGTLSEIALALKMGKPVISLGSWQVTRDILPAPDPAAAVKLALKKISAGATRAGRRANEDRR
jgi:uncharacterized protein (TIGR00725 family)